MNLTSARLEIRVWQEADAHAFFELTQDAGFNLHPISVYKQQDVNSAREWIQKNFALQPLGKFGAWLKSDNSLIGMGGLTPYPIEGEEVVDLTYRLHSRAWGKGIGGELAVSLVRHGFETLKLSEITATITPDNIGSKKIAEKLGFRFDRRIILLGVDTDLYRLRHESMVDKF